MNLCPKCGCSSTSEVMACVNCGQVMANGVAPKATIQGEKPPPPPEVSGWVIHQTPPEMIEELRRTFNEEEYLAELREVERTGGVKFEDFFGEIKEMVKRRD